MGGGTGDFYLSDEEFKELIYTNKIITFLSNHIFSTEQNAVCPDVVHYGLIREGEKIGLDDTKKYLENMTEAGLVTKTENPKDNGDLKYLYSLKVD